MHSQNVTLPTDTATLTAYPDPEEPADHPYTYEWSIHDQTGEEEGGGDGNGRSGVMESRTEKHLKLSKLEEGKYMFKVTVTGTDPVSLDSKGEALGTVTVFPGKSFQMQINVSNSNIML